MIVPKAKSESGGLTMKKWRWLCVLLSCILVIGAFSMAAHADFGDYGGDSDYGDFGGFDSDDDYDFDFGEDDNDDRDNNRRFRRLRQWFRTE